MTGFSARFIGGGVGLVSLVSRSLLSSADRRGGGGDGGWEGTSLGDLRGSRIGVCGRLGILNCFECPPGEEGFMSESVCKKAGRSPTAISGPRFGGDGEWGGSTMSEGGCMGRGLKGGAVLRFGELGPLTLPPALGACKPVRFNLSFGLVLGTVGGSRDLEGLASRIFSGFGAGEIALGGGLACASPGLFMFSNLARREDTGFYVTRLV